MSDKKNQDFMQEFQEFGKFFDESVKKFGREDSERYKNVKKQFQNSYAVMRKYQNETITLDNMAEMTEARKALMDACSSYVSENKRAFTGTGQKRLNAIRNILDYCETFEYNRLRETKNWEQYKGKTWGELESMPMAKVEIENTKNSVGGLANERYFVKNGETKGFFTPQKVVLSEDDAFKDALKDIKNAEQAEFLNNAKDTLKSYAASVCNASQLGVNENVALQSDTYREIGQIKSRKDRESFNKLFSNHFDKMVMIRAEIQNNHPEVKTGSAEENKKIIGDIIEKTKFNRDEKKDNEIRTLFLENKERLLNFATKKVPELKGDEAAEAQMNASFLADVDKTTSKLLNDPELKKHALDIMKKIQASENLQSNELAGLKPNDELTGRNTASSRLADEFGVGNLLARSKDVTAQINGKEVKGCYMEFAEGIDLRNSHGDDLKTLNEMNFTSTPTFNRDVCNLEILDYICAQADRHAGNIFLKVDPETKQPIGLQGIDNDLCLTERYPKDLVPIGKNNSIPMKQPPLEDLHFMSEDMAKKIQKIEPKDLERLVGDKLSEGELKALQARVNAVKDHIKNNVFLVKNDADWSLGNYDNLVKPENLKENEARELFDKARKELEDGLNPDMKDGPKHQNASILAEVNEAKKRYQKELGAESNQKIEEEREKKQEKEDMAPKPEQKLSENHEHKLNRPEDAVEEKTDAKVENLKEDGTEKVKEYDDGKKVKVVSGENNQFIRSETGYKTPEEKKQLTSLFGLMKESHDKNIAAQRDANERDANIKEKKEEIKKRNERENQIKDEAGNIREIPKTPEKGQSAIDIMKNASRQNREQAKVNKGAQRNGQREKDNSFKAELNKSRERKTNLKLGTHRENVGMLDNRSKKDALKLDQGMKDNRSKKDALKGGPKK